MKTHHDLEVWKISIKFVDKIYDLTDNFPEKEKYALSSQMQRAAVSVASNIAEGAARNHNKEFIQFLYHSFGSLSELETQIIISANRKYINSTKEILDELSHIQKLLYGLIKYLKNKML
ncbi:MAG: four helix bundle protein [Candidatus Marinimicrobia bacterium]|nr:four helix bundle protein [Candidatus Neomarinimicrobiota bacterium]